MSFFSFIIGMIVGGGLVMLVVRGGQKSSSNKAPNPNQTIKKQKNLDKILDFLDANEEISNDQIEAILDVADSTATNYMEELEQLGLVEQIGETGRGVKYRKVKKS